MYVPSQASFTISSAACSIVSRSPLLRPCPGRSTNTSVGSSPSVRSIRLAQRCQWWCVCVKPWRKTSRRSGIADVVFADRCGLDDDAVLQFAQDVDERVGVLGPGDRPAAVDHERRHAGDAVVDRLLDLGAHLAQTGVRIQEGDDGFTVETDLSRACRQHLRVADVQTVVEVGLQQTLLERGLWRG